MVIQCRKVSRETPKPCGSVNFSTASVGPKSAYRSQTSAIANSRYSGSRRRLIGRPRCLEMSLAAPKTYELSRILDVQSARLNIK
jgi:hypothetical protein